MKKQQIGVNSNQILIPKNLIIVIFEIGFEIYKIKIKLPRISNVFKINHLIRIDV